MAAAAIHGAWGLVVMGVGGWGAEDVPAQNSQSLHALGPFSRTPNVCPKSFAKVFFDLDGSMAPPLPRTNPAPAMSVVAESAASS